MRAASAVGEGGVFIRLFEMAYGGGLGVDLSLDSSAGSLEGLLFSECIGSVLVEVSSDSDLPELLGDLPYLVLGRTISEPAIRVAYCGDSVELPMDDLVTAWESTFGEVVL